MTDKWEKGRPEKSSTDYNSLSLEAFPSFHSKDVYAIVATIVPGNLFTYTHVHAEYLFVIHEPSR